MNRTERKALAYAEAISYRAEILRMYSTDKGIPVPETGKRSKGGGFQVSAGKPNGVMGGSRILPHRYRSELDNGSMHRRQIRRKERSAWVCEWQDEQYSELCEMEAFGSWE